MRWRAARPLHGLSVAKRAAARPIEARLVKSVNMFGGSGAPCGGRGYRGGPRPAKGANTPASAEASAPLLRPNGRCAPIGARIGPSVQPPAGLRPAYGRPPASLRPAYGPAACATLRPEVCNAHAGAFRHSGDAAVQ